MTVMLYKAPGSQKLHEVMVDTLIVDEDAVDDQMAEGWHKTPLDAHEAHLNAQVEEVKPRRGRPPKQKPEAE